MLTIITETGIYTNPMKIFIHRHGDDTATIEIWANHPRDIHFLYCPITPTMSDDKANNLYHRIADQVAAGVKVIDLRKWISQNESHD